MNFIMKLLSGNKFNLIPIITRIFLTVVLTFGNLGIGNQIKYKIRLGFLSFLSATVLKLGFPKKDDSGNPKNQCESEDFLLGIIPLGQLIVSTMDAIIQYGCAFLIPKAFIFIPIVGMFLRGATKIPIIGNLVDFVYWIIGFRAGMWLSSPWTDSGFCRGSSSIFKKLLFVICLLAVYFIEFVSTMKDAVF